MHEALWHSISADAAIAKLGSDRKAGLSREEASRRLQELGPNELKKEAGISPLALFFSQFKNVLVLILLAATILSAFVGEYVDAAIILVIVVFCAVLGFVQEYRAERALEALKKMLSPVSRVIRSGHKEDIPSAEIVPGDLLLLEAGDKVPADARLVEGASLRCDEAPLTGESAPVGKEPAALPAETQMADRRNIAFTGTTVTYGRARAVVVATGMNTELGRIASEVAAVETEMSPLEKRTNEIGKWLGIICLTICGAVAVIGLGRELIGGEVDVDFVVGMVMFAVALAVAAVPEALAAIVTGALALGMHAMAKRNALVRRMPAVETLGCTTIICSDKTGTLTRGEMTVRKIYADGDWVEVTGVGYAPRGELKGAAANPGHSAPLALLLQAGVLCTDAELLERSGQWAIKGDPTEAALIVAAVKAGLDADALRERHARVAEVPFSSERKRMTTVHRMDGEAATAFMKGAPEVVLECCTAIRRGDAVAPLTAADKAEILDANAKMAAEALRVLAVAYREVEPGDGRTGEEIEKGGMVFLGLAGMIDPPREEAIAAVKTCRQVHIKPIMITGDHKLTAVAVAKELDIFREGDIVLTGAELERMSEEDLAKVVHKVTVYARVSPMDKLKIVRAWKARGEVVAMTGDGVNDAPALKHADIGVAMGITGTDVAKEAADMVLSDDNFATIVSAIERGRWIYDNIKKYLAYLLQCNITEVIVIGGIVLFKGHEFLPLLPAAILYINLATDGLPALALGVAPADRDIMKRPPRDPKESVFGWDVKFFVLRAVFIECPFFYFIFFSNLGNMTHARTMVFFLFIIVEFVIALNCRSLKHSVFRAPPHKWLLIALGWELALAAVLVQIPAVRDAFGILKPSLGDLAAIAGFGVAVFAVIEATKVLLRRNGPVPRERF